MRAFLVRPRVEFRVGRLRVTLQRGQVNGFRQLTDFFATVPGRRRGPLRLRIDGRLQVVDRRADLGPRHVGHERKIVTAIPERHEGDVDFAVVQPLENIFKPHSVIANNWLIPTRSHCGFRGGRLPALIVEAWLRRYG